MATCITGHVYITSSGKQLAKDSSFKSTLTRKMAPKESNWSSSNARKISQMCMGKTTKSGHAMCKCLSIHKWVYPFLSHLLREFQPTEIDTPICSTEPVLITCTYSASYIVTHGNVCILCKLLEQYYNIIYLVPIENITRAKENLYLW